jgi:chemotaxis protein histidine kinase CheA
LTNEERYRQIMEATKALFLEELRAKSAYIVEQIEQWREGSLPDADLIERLYRSTHTLKGVAVTVGFSDVHEVAERVSECKYRSDLTAISADEMEELTVMASVLGKYR